MSKDEYRHKWASEIVRDVVLIVCICWVLVSVCGTVPK